MSAACLTDADTGKCFSTEIDAGVSELCWVDVEVTCDVCIVVCFSHIESPWIVVGENGAAAVDEVAITFFTNLLSARSRHTRTVVPSYT